MQYKISILDYLQFDCPTLEQKMALLAMSKFVNFDNEDDFLILSGAAGTGKTSITTALIGYLNSSSISYNIAAPTGRAARILGRKSKTLNSTIHSLIYNTKPNPKTGEIIFTLKENNVKDYTVYIIDEASMISSKIINDKTSLFKCNSSLLNDLISFVKKGNPLNKIVFLGDRNQLPPINELESMALCEEYLTNKFSLKGSSHLLTEVKRQEDGSYILKYANKIRIGIDNKLKSVVLQGIQKQNIYKASDNYLKEYLNNGMDSVISIGTTHKMNTLFNNIVRKNIYGISPKIIELKDLLIITQTWRRNGNQLYSGDHVLIEEAKMDKIETIANLRFVPVKLRCKNLNDHDQIIEDYILLDCLINPKGLSAEQESKLRHERFKKNKIYRESGNSYDDRYVGAIRANYGHSITCNKAQGGEWNKVLINSYYMPSLRYQYTAITRAKKSLVFY
tara:strand:- start:703 stop:2052 length:1350 start_codon:yes stop_codon:yes gene_type:complete